MRTFTAFAVIVAAFATAGCARKREAEQKQYSKILDAPGPQKKVVPDPPTERVSLIAPRPTQTVAGVEAGVPSGPGSSNAAAMLVTFGVRNARITDRQIKLLVPTKTFSRSGKALRITYNDFDLLKVLNMDPVPTDCVKYFPDWLKQLDGKKIRVRGFMYPPSREVGLRAFTLARDNQICCFGKFPMIYDLVYVIMKDDTTTRYIPNRAFDVEGVFRIDPWVKKGELLELFVIEDARVIRR